MKESGWIFQRNNTMGQSIFKPGELNGSSYVKVPSRGSAILNVKNDDKYCFLWSILAKLHPISDSKNGHAAKVSNYEQYFNELNVSGFDFLKGFKCSDMHKFE